MALPGEPLPREPGTSAANWQLAPFNRWAFWHVDEILPTQRVARGDGPVSALPDHTADHDVLGVEVIRIDGSRATVREVLADTFTDAYAVAQDGALVGEGYPTGGPDQTHAVMSVTKSLVGCVTAVLADRGLLGVDDDVDRYVPELSVSGYGGATIRQLLDMRSGARFREDYTDPAAEVRQLDDWVLGSAGDRNTSGASPVGGGGLYAFLQTLRAEAEHGSRFLYRSSETDVLGWVCERAGGASMAELISTLVWAPMGAEQDALIICDSQGTALHDGGLIMTARDLLRFGQLLLSGGVVTGDRDEPATVLPPKWLRHAWAVDADGRQAFLSSPNEASFPGGWYRNQFWFRPGEHGDVLLCLGIHGQLLHVSRRTGTVCVKFSSWPNPTNPVFLQDTLRAFDAVGGAMVNRSSTGVTKPLPGIVSGLTRGEHGGSRRGSGSALP